MPVELTAPGHLYLASVAASAAFAGWAWYSYRSGGLSLFVVARLFLAILAGPMWSWQLASSSILLDRTTIAWTTGFPWSPEPHSVDLAGLRSVQVTEIGTGRSRSEAWILTYRDGTRREVSPTDIWRANQEEIADYFSRLGIQLPR